MKINWLSFPGKNLKFSIPEQVHDGIYVEPQTTATTILSVMILPEGGSRHTVKFRVAPFHVATQGEHTSYIVLESIALNPKNHEIVICIYTRLNPDEVKSINIFGQAIVPNFLQECTSFWKNLLNLKSIYEQHRL